MCIADTQLLNSAEFRCSEEILTIAAMTSVQGVFNMPDGGPNTTKGALAEVERRKFTAEEGDHLTLLNGTSYFLSSSPTASQLEAVRS